MPRPTDLGNEFGLSLCRKLDSAKRGFERIWLARQFPIYECRCKCSQNVSGKGGNAKLPMQFVIEPASAKGFDLLSPTDIGSDKHSGRSEEHTSELQSLRH